MASSKIRKIKVSTGIYWLEIPGANLRILCGAPADAIKHLKKRGLVETVENQGVSYETGPNAILLSDAAVQNGRFANLTEFPVMQMLYLQGMYLPNHPNNTGELPLLIGTEAQVRTQMKYIYRGNYGLVSEAEIRAAGIDAPLADALMRIKRYFAFGKILKPEAFLTPRIVKDAPLPLKNGVSISRLGFNHYRISYQDAHTSVNLNLAANQEYEAPYKLSYHSLPRSYFAVVHSGEGNGWDTDRPCMSSILMFQGKIYLIDAGPNIITSLNYLGISLNEVSGIFHTHAHDDHFAGLTTLAQSDHRFKYYATRLVRSAVAQKMGALLNVPAERFETFFDIQDLAADRWNNIAGLEVCPGYSPHPVETNLFFFRCKKHHKYKVYAHLADTVSLKVWAKIANGDTANGHLSKAWFHKIKSRYLIRADLKKIDVGGGLIHGDAADYEQDQSAKIVFAHTDRPLTLAQRKIGSSAAFGMIDILIKGTQNYLLEAAKKYLKKYFPTLAAHEINYLINQPIENINAGSVLLKKNRPIENVYLLLTGSVGFSDAHIEGIQNFSAGSLLGFYSGYFGQTAKESYWATSNINVLKISVSAYKALITRAKLTEDLQKFELHLSLLKNTRLFEKETISFPVMIDLSKILEVHILKAGTHLELQDNPNLYLIGDGKANLQTPQNTIPLQENDFFSGSPLLSNTPHIPRITLQTDSLLYSLPLQTLKQIPVAYQKLWHENHNRSRILGICPENR